MPSLWKRGTLAALISAQLAGGSVFAQQPQTRGASNPHCTQIAPPPYTADDGTVPLHQWQPIPQDAPTPPAQPMPTDPSEVPSPPENVPPESPMAPESAMPPDSAMPPETSPSPMDTPAQQDALTPPDATGDFSFAMAQAGIGSPDAAFGGAPNMMGDLLRAYRGVTFGYLQAGDFSVANTSGAVNFRNSKVAENNSAIPRDRVSFRYNYFKGALQVDGLESSPFLGPRISQTPTSPIRQFNLVQPASESYNVHLYTFGLEKTFLDNLASIEVRLPFARTIDSDLNLVSGMLLSDVPNTVPLVQPTPGETLGDSDTEFQDMSVILKGIIAQDPNRRWVVSTGLGVSIPTGKDLNARVVDFSNDVAQDRPLGDLVFPPDSPEDVRRRMTQFAFDQRTRWFEIENETWGISPFLAAAATPTDKTFVNAFAQVEIPLNQSEWRFREQDIDLELLFDPTVSLANSPIPRELQHIQFDRSASGKIEDQHLLHLDIGGGYWFFRNPCHDGLTGLAGLMELHYTGTLDDADIVVVNETPIRTFDASGLIGPLPPPRLGNIANQVHILNYTVGGVVTLGQNITLATAYVVPLRDDLDRTFDGELNVQLNVYR